MGSLRSFRCFFVVAMVFAVAAAAHAAAVRSTMGRNDSAVMMHSGFFLNPVGTEPRQSGDLAPVQLFEIVRPNNQAINIGRLFTSCVCVTLEADKTSFAAGEPAILRLRNLKPTPQSGQLYAVYVQLNSPIRTVLRFDTFVQSSQFIPSAAGEPPTRGDVVADGVYVPVAASTKVGDDGIEIIVPKADNYIPDTSEYTLRKKREAEAASGSLSKGAEKKAETAADAVAAKADEVAAKMEKAADKAEEAADKTEKAAEKVEEANARLREKIAAGIENMEKKPDAAATGAERQAEMTAAEAKVAAKKAAVAARIAARESAQKTEAAASTLEDGAAAIAEDAKTAADKAADVLETAATDAAKEVEKAADL